MKTWEEITQEIERCKGEKHIAEQCHDGYTARIYERIYEQRIATLEWVMNVKEKHGR